MSSAQLPIRARCRAALLAAALLALTPIGCGVSGMGSVSGRVTYQGKPVPKGTITFVTRLPNKRNAVGALQADGSYQLQTEQPGDGAGVGDYVVTVYAHDEPVLDYIPAKPVKPKLLAPAKYENPDTSGLKATVTSGSNRFDFTLTD